LQRSSGSPDLDRLLREWEEEDRELRELRRRSADWEYVRGLPPKVREAVELYIETGDLRSSQRLSGLPLDEFTEMLKRARVWTG